MAFLSYLEFREEFPYVVNKKVNCQCTTANCNDNSLEGYYDVTPRVYIFSIFSTLAHGAALKTKLASRIIPGEVRPRWGPRGVCCPRDICWLEINGQGEQFFRCWPWPGNFTKFWWRRWRWIIVLEEFDNGEEWWAWSIF